MLEEYSNEMALIQAERARPSQPSIFFRPYIGPMVWCGWCGGGVLIISVRAILGIYVQVKKLIILPSSLPALLYLGV